LSETIQTNLDRLSFFADSEYDKIIAWNASFAYKNWELQVEFYLICPEFSKNDFSPQRKEKEKKDVQFDDKCYNEWNEIK